MRHIHARGLFSLLSVTSFALAGCSVGAGDPAEVRSIAQGDGVGASPCQTPDALKLAADAACQAEGMVPSALDLLDDCGDGTYRSADPKCVPPPDTSSSACTSGVVGDGVTCADPAILDKTAEEACLQAGLALVDFAPDGAGCGGQASQAKYACCPAAPPPGDPGPGCFSGAIGDGVTCQSAEAFAAAAAALCATKDLAVVDLQTDQDCPDGGWLVAKFDCCTGP